MGSPLKIFIIYARKDKRYKDDLLKSIKLLQNQGIIEPWHDSDIKPGEEYDKEIIAHLRAADIILPIISFDFFDSDYINRVEIKEAFERYFKGEVKIIPIIADSCPWWDSPELKGLQVLPEEAKPIDDWPVKSKALTSIYDGVKRIILDLKNPIELVNPYHKKEEKTNKITQTKSSIKKEVKKNTPLDEVYKERENRRANRLFDLAEKTTNLNEKIEYYSNAIEINNKFEEAYCQRGIATIKLNKYDEALIDFDKAIEINPRYHLAYFQRGWIKFHFKKYEESIIDFTKAIQFESLIAQPYYWRGLAKLKLERFNEAIIDFDKAAQLNHSNVNVFINRGVAKERLELWSYAKEDYQKVLEIEPNNETAKNYLKNIEAKLIQPN